MTDSQVCVHCEPPPATAKAPERRCKDCPKITTSKTGYCRKCNPTWLAARKPTAAHALKPPKGLDGRWVNVQGVRRWVTWPVQDVA